MNPHSVVRLIDGEGNHAGMGTVISKRYIATVSYVIGSALGLRDPILDAPEAPISLQLSSSKSVITSHVASWIPMPLPPNSYLAILQVPADVEDILSPAPLITARDTDFYFDRRFRMLGSMEGLEYVYVRGALEGTLPNGIVQMRFDSEQQISRSSAGSAVWDIDSGRVLGIYLARYSPGPIGFMVPTHVIANSLPDSNLYSSDYIRLSSRREAKIFICHANEDSAAAVEIYDKLEASGFDPWLDKKSILPGQMWDYEIREAVKAAKFLIVLLSQISVQKKGYVQREFKLAMEVLETIPEGQIYLIPAKLGECLVPSQFASFQWVDLTGPGGYDQIQRAIEFQLTAAMRQGSGAGD